LMMLDPRNGQVSSVLERRWSESFKGVNDLVFAGNDDIYFTDQGQTGLHDPTGRVYRLRTNGTLDLIVGNVPSPNGLVLNGAEHILYVAATRGNSIWRIPLMPDGTASKVGIFVQLSASLGGPDGLAMDEEDNLAVAHAGLGAVWIFSRLGEPLYRIHSCEGLATTNVAYGGADNKSLYITESESGCVLVARVPVAGRLMVSHQ
jgi:gluconolactonase